MLRLLESLKGTRGRNIIFLRSPRFHPFDRFKDFGDVRRLAGAPSAASGRRLAAALAAFRPDVLVTEFFPFGRRECAPELGPALDAAAMSGARLVSSLPMPYFTAPEKDLPRLAEECRRYDRILVHSPAGADLPYMAKAVRLERRVGERAFSAFFDGLSDRAVFTGYLLPRKMPRPSRGGYILASRGGGSTSGELIEAAIAAAAELRLSLVAVAGPASTPAELRRFKALASSLGGGAEVLREAPDMISLIAGAEACVSTAGGSVYEMLALRKRMVLAPYCGTRGREHSDQLARAWLMRDAAGAGLLLPGGVTPSGVASALRRALARKPSRSPRVKPSWFAGAARSVEEICRL